MDDPTPIGALVAAPTPEADPTPIGGTVQDPELQKDEQLRTIFDAGLTKASDEHAGVLAVAKQLQVPAALVAERYPEFKRQAEASQFDPRRFRTDNPELAAFLVDQPTMAPVVRDDSANLTGIEYWLTGRKGKPRFEGDIWGDTATPPFWAAILSDSVKQSEMAVRQTLDLVRAQAGRAVDSAMSAAMVATGFPVAGPPGRGGFSPAAAAVQESLPDGRQPEPFSSENTARIDDLRSQIPSARDYGIDEIPFRPARAVAGAVSDLIQFVPAIGGTIVSASAGGAMGGPPGALSAAFAFNYALTAGPEYAAKRDVLDASGRAGDPALEDEAIWAATLGGTTNAGIMSVGSGPIARGIGTKLGLGKFMRLGAPSAAKVVRSETVGRVLARGVTQFGTHWGEGVATMVAMSGVSAGLQESFRSDVAGDEFQAGQVGEAMVRSAEETAVSMAILSGFSMPVRQYLTEVGQARLLDQNIGRLRRSVESAAASKAIEQAPAEAADLIGRLARAGDASTVYVEKAEFDRLYQAKGVPPREVAAAFLGDGGKAWDQASVTGGDIPVPAEVFLTKMARTQEGLALSDISRLPQDARTPRQAREVAQRVGKAIREQAAAAVSAGQPTPHDAIREDFKTKAIAAGRSELEAATNAEVVARAFTWFGAQTGRDPLEVYRTEMPATIHGPNGQAAAAQFPQASQLLSVRFDKMTPAERAREVYIDANTGILNERAFRALPADPARPLVAHISVEGTKWLNTKDHALGDRLYAAAAQALHGLDPEAAKVGGDFAIRVRDQAQLDQVLARLNETMPVKGVTATGALGGDFAAAGEAHVALKKQLEASGARAQRGERPLGVQAQEPGQVAFPATRAAAEVPVGLAAQHAALLPAEAFRSAYVEPETGVLTAAGWNGIPRKEYLASIDLNGLKALNERAGSPGGDAALRQLGILARKIGGESFDFAHLHGDEYAAQHNDPKALQGFLDRLAAVSDNVRLKVRGLDGTVQEIQGLSFGRGVGKTNAESEAALAAHKLELTAAGKRGPEADARRLRPVAEAGPGGDVAQRRSPLERGGAAGPGRAGTQDYAGAGGVPEGVAAARLPEGAVVRLAPKRGRGGERGFFQVQYDAGGTPIRGELHLASADRSTLPHETMHWFSEVLQRLSEQPGASADLKENYQVLLRAMEYTSPRERAVAGKERRALAAKAKLTPHEAARLKTLVGREEKVSHLWEQYLLEGKAPTAEMLPVFARFKTWFTRIYRTAEGLRDQYRQTYGEDLVLTPEVRQVFQRMLAGDEAVADAARQLAAEQPAVKFTPEEQAQAGQLQAEARTRAELEVQRLISREEKSADREYMKTARAQVEAEVLAELDQNPVYNAIGALEGVLAGAPGHLDRELVVKQFGVEVADALPKGTIGKEGLSPDVAADFLGFPSGETLVRALAGAEPRADLVKREVGNRMRELYPSLAERPRLLAAVAAEQLHDAAFLREGVLRLRAMAREAGLGATVPTAKELASAAEQMIQETRIVELRADRFELAAKAAARRASEAADPKLRAAEYETYLLNRALQRAAGDARSAAEKDAAFLQGFTTNRGRAKLGLADAAVQLPGGGTAAGPGYLDQVDGLLSAFEFRASATLKDVRSREAQALALQRWVQERLADGDSMVVPESVMQNLARSTHWKDLTPGELKDLRFAVESIAQQAKLRRVFHVGEQAVQTEQVIGELVDAALKNGRGITTGLASNIKTVGERVGSVGRKAQFMVEHPELLMQGLDGHKEGPWTKYVWNVLSDASYRYHDLVRSSSGEVQQLLRGLPAAERQRLKRQDIFLEGQRKPISLENVVAVLANAGNESNLSKLIRGMSDPRLRLYGEVPWNGRNTFDEILSHATQREVDLAQKMIDAHEGYWAKAEALEKLDVGLAPRKIQGKRLKFVGADGKQLEGPSGYYPVIYSRKFKIGQQQMESDAAGVMGMPGVFNRAYDAASTPQGYLQERIDSYARPFDLTLDALPRKLAMTAKDIAFRMDAKQLYRVLTDDRVMGALHQAVGEEGYNVIIHHLQDSVNDVMIPDAGAGLALQVINRARGLVSEAIFGLNVQQTMQNLADVAGVKAVVPQGRFATASLRIARDIPGEVEVIKSKSAEMRLRADGVRSSVLSAMHDAFRKSEIGMHWDHAKQLFMVPFETTNAMVEYPVWRGAYDHALAPKEAKGLGLSEAEAVRHADSAVRTLFGGKRTVDLSPIQRDKIMRHFTMFYGWANAQLNLFLKAAGEGKVQWSEGRRVKALGTIGGAFALLWAKQLASELLSGRGPEDKEKDGIDAGDVSAWAAWRGAMTLPLSAPIIGSAVRSLQGQQSRDVSLTPWLSLLNAGVKGVRATYQAVTADQELTDDQEINLFLAWMEAGGQATGAPVVQARQTAKYWQGRTGSEGVPEDIFGTAYGPPRSGKLNALFGE
jgi:GGDEF domain-containing protein